MKKHIRIVRVPKDYVFQWQFCTSRPCRFGTDTRDWYGFVWGYWNFLFCK